MKLEQDPQGLIHQKWHYFCIFNTYVIQTCHTTTLSKTRLEYRARHLFADVTTTLLLSSNKGWFKTRLELKTWQTFIQRSGWNYEIWGKLVVYWIRVPWLVFKTREYVIFFFEMCQSTKAFYSSGMFIWYIIFLTIPNETLGHCTYIITFETFLFWGYPGENFLFSINLSCLQWCGEKFFGCFS